MEYCSGGDLQTLIEKRTLEKGRFSEAVFFFFFFSVFFFGFVISF
jgi:hypothetical protein